MTVSNWFHLSFTHLHFNLAAPPRMFDIAFKMFDLNGDGDVEYEEFEKVMITVHCLLRMGSKL